MKKIAHFAIVAILLFSCNLGKGDTPAPEPKPNPNAKALVAPTGITVVPTDVVGELKVTWGAVANNNGYEITYKKGSDTNTVSAQKDATTQTLSSLVGGQEYSVSIKTKGDNSLFLDSPYSQEIKATPKAGNTPEQNLKEMIETDEALTIIKENAGNKNFVILDVRTNAEFKEGYIEGHMPEPEEQLTPPTNPTEEELFDMQRGVLQHDIYDGANFDTWLTNRDKGKRYLLYCRTDKRSEKAFQKLKAAGFKQIQYMKGGYTKWANEDKPVIIPNYKKALDVLVKGNKIKTMDSIKFDFHVTNLTDDPIRKGKLSAKIVSLANTNTDIHTESLTTNDTGDATYTFQKGSNANGKYRLICTATHKYKDKNKVEHDYIPGVAYYDFEIADEDKEVSGSPTEITIEDDIKDTIANKFYNRNIYAYKVYNAKKELITLQDKVDASKPTLVILFSPLCGGCMTKAQDLIKYKLDPITVIPVITSVEKDKLDTQIPSTEKDLKDTYKLDEFVPHELYDCEDEIWGARFKFKSTPKFILINTDGQIKDIVYGSEKFKIETLIQKMQEKFNLPAFEKKS